MKDYHHVLMIRISQRHVLYKPKQDLVFIFLSLKRELNFNKDIVNYNFQKHLFMMLVHVYMDIKN